MCGILALLDPGTPPAEREAVAARLLARMRHRGPNDRGTFHDDGVTLAMCRLSILDLSADGHQPMFNEDGAVAVVFNGEIYNFATLRAELEALGHRFRSRADTEVLVHGYEAWGLAGLLERLNGMYAFALLDRRTRTTYIARDRVGVKPLYLWRDGRRLVACSELSTLLAHPAVAARLDPEAVLAYLAYQFVPGPRTVVAGVEKVPPGTWLEIHDGRVRAHRYWEPRAGRVALPRGRAETVVQCRDLLADAVRLQLVADVPVGLFLSGGLDSSLLAALAARVQGEPPRTFSIGFAGFAAFDESAHSTAVARHLATRHRALAFGADELSALLDPVVDAMDEPIGDAAAIPTYLLARTAVREVTVVLTGEGADELFAGYDYYRALPAAERGLRARLRAALGRDGDAGNGATAVSGFPYANPPARLRELAPWASPAALAALGRRERAVVRRVGAPDALTAAQGWDIAWWLADDLLMKCDKMTMAHSLEGRVPFLDHRLVDLALSLPPELKLGPAGGKAILREAAADLLPPEIVGREKHGFNLPLHVWIRGELRERVEAVLRGPALAALEVVDRAAVGRLLDGHLAGTAEASRSLWTVFCLAHWWARRRAAAPAAGIAPAARAGAAG